LATTEVVALTSRRRSKIEFGIERATVRVTLEADGKSFSINFREPTAGEVMQIGWPVDFVIDNHIAYLQRVRKGEFTREIGQFAFDTMKAFMDQGRMNNVAPVEEGHFRAFLVPKS